MKYIVTGGAGFIGGAVVRHLVMDTDSEVLVVDALTYAGNLQSLAQVSNNESFSFAQINICDRESLANAVVNFRPDIVMHLAAESHVDRSIDGPGEFMQTNIIGTFILLEVVRDYINSGEAPTNFRFHHISTDEVFGDLGITSDLFTESSSYDPSSPYSASKAASDHLVRAWGRTYGIPYVMTNCSNNYGPFHFPEKLIPLVILRALAGQYIPVYGDGSQIRDWLYVEDHARALVIVANRGALGETYNIGGHNEKTNLEVVEGICDQFDRIQPESAFHGDSYRKLITFVEDRPGHDIRYAIDASKISTDLGWQPQETFESGIEKTVSWYLENSPWWQSVLDGSYQLDRLGTGAE